MSTGQRSYGGSSFATHSASAPAPIDPAPEFLLGTLEYDAILAAYPAWRERDAAVSPDPARVEALRAIERPLAIECYLGTWCGDSRAGVPPVVRALQAAGNANITMELIGVDRDKVDPEFRAPAHAIERVPTFIVYRDGQEIARLIEFPMSDDFVADLLASLP